MVHISLPPEPPAIVMSIESSARQADSLTQKEHSPNGLLDLLLAGELTGELTGELASESSSNLASNLGVDLASNLASNLGSETTLEPTVQLSNAATLAQTAETDLPRLPAETDSETDDVEITPDEENDEGRSEEALPADNLPADNLPADNLPADDLPTETPANSNPANGNPANDTPGNDTPGNIEDSQTTEEFISQLRLTSDTQVFDPVSQTITARGNVVLRLNDANIEASELWVNLINRYALADGNVLLTRGAQLVEGSRLEYNFIQRSGTVSDAVGTLYLPAIEEDFSSPLAGVSASRRAYDPIGRDGLLVENDGNLLYGTPLATQAAAPPISDVDADGNERNLLNQLRFETDELTFDVNGWRADSVRITNDPFSPPELELRTDSLVLRNVSPTQDELLLKRPRLVFDQGFAVPLLRSRILLSRGNINPEDLSPVPAPIGIDSGDRGGLYLGAKIPLITEEKVRLTVTPQFFVGRAVSGENGSPIDADNFGATSDLRAQISDRTLLTSSADLTSLNLSNVTENLRADVRLTQLIGTHNLSLQYGYRDRLFNGSLGFQNVQSSFGALLLSPTFNLGNSGLQLTYQASAQVINARTDRPGLLTARNSDTGRVTLGRYQGSVALRRGFGLWRGEPKPATQEQGLRFTPQPVVPYLNLGLGARSTFTQYTNGDSQNSLIADIGLEAQLGHFARNFGDYTRLNLGYSQSFIGQASSPFLFDREVDRNVLSLGITQQIYGPFLAGFQTALSFSGGRPINNIYSLEYSRRTYGLLLRYDTTQNIGSIGFRLSNFRWIGDTNPFDTPRIRQVRGGVVETR